MRFKVLKVALLHVFTLAASSGTLQVEAAERQDVTASSKITASVVISGFKYQPDVVTVHRGDSIQWRNADIVPHTATSVGDRFDSHKIPPGGNWTFVAKKVGTFNYNCTLHPNMKGKLVVR